MIIIIIIFSYKISWMCMTYHHYTTKYSSCLIMDLKWPPVTFTGYVGRSCFVRTYQADRVRGPVTPFNWCIIYKTISSSFLNKKWSVLRKDCCTKKLFFQDFFFKQYIPIAFLSIAELLLQFLIKNMVLIRLRAPNQKFLWIFPHKNLMAW